MAFLPFIYQMFNDCNYYLLLTDVYFVHRNSSLLRSHLTIRWPAAGRLPKFLGNPIYLILNKLTVDVLLQIHWELEVKTQK